MCSSDLGWLTADDDDLRERYDRLFVPRNDPRYLRRNALVALGNAGDPGARSAAEAFAEGDDKLSFGKMEPLVALLQETPAEKVLPILVDRLQTGTTLPELVSAAALANGVQGTYLHVRGIAQRPGGWRYARYNVEMGPPLFAPLLFAMVGGMGLLASILRREGGR